MKIVLAKIAFVALGFFGALNFMRARSFTFDWHMGMIYPQWFNLHSIMNFEFHNGFRMAISFFIFFVGIAGFAFLIFRTKKNFFPPLQRIDFSLIVLICGAGFYACFLAMRGVMFSPWEITRGVEPERFFTVNISYMQPRLFLFPIAAYALALFAYAELIARFRDKKLFTTLYWLNFFATYKFFPVGFFALATLVCQFCLLFFSPYTILKIFSLFTICALTFFAKYLLNLSKEYELANEEKVRAEQFKTELITNVSHDIRTPLTSIINYVDLLKNENLPTQAAEYLQVLEKKSARLKILIDDLMEASKAGTGNIKIEKTEINLCELVGQVAGEFEDAFSARGLTLVIRAPNAAVTIFSDSRHLYRALENLFSNAAKYAMENTRVFAETSLQNEKIIFTMQNTAQSPLELSGKDVTAQFMRGDKARNTEGSGLGLYIAKSLVELLNGNFKVSIYGDLFQVEMMF
jgi:signal transduction histidine kinase